MWVDEGQISRIGAEFSNHLLNFSSHPEMMGQVTKYPPFYPLLLAFSTYLFGNTGFAVRIVSPLMGVVGVGLTYFLGREIMNRETGLIAAMLVSINPIFWFLSERILIGATLTVTYTAAVLLWFYGLEDREYSRYAIWLSGPATALAIMTKQPAYSLGIVLPAYFLLKNREEVKELFTTEVDLTDSKFLESLKNRDYYIAAGLGFGALLPVVARSVAVCRLPLCGLDQATNFATKSGNTVLSSVQGPLFFIYSLPSILTLPIAALLVFKLTGYVLKLSDRDPDYLIKVAALTIFTGMIAFLVDLRFLVLATVPLFSLLPERDGEKLLWLWTGVGLGVMSLPSVKVPRYVVFVVPAMVTLATIALWEISEMVSSQIDSEYLDTLKVAAVIAVPLILISYGSGAQNASRGAFGPIEQAGEWIDQNADENAEIAGSSKNALKYYIYPRISHNLPDNKSRAPEYILKNNIQYVEVDTYERTQPHWLQTDVPPYRIPERVKIQLRRKQVSPQQVADSFSKPPEYLEPVAEFGKTRVPLTRNQEQPGAIVYRVNTSYLR